MFIAGVLTKKIGDLFLMRIWGTWTRWKMSMKHKGKVFKIYIYLVEIIILVQFSHFFIFFFDYIDTISRIRVKDIELKQKNKT